MKKLIIATILMLGLAAASAMAELHVPIIIDGVQTSELHVPIIIDGVTPVNS